MKAADLLKVLNVAKPALGSADSVLPVLSHFCFDGEAAYAYNDIAAIIVENSTGLRCALHGDTLTALLGAAGDTDVMIKVHGNAAKLDFGKGSDADLPYLPPETFIFKFPDESVQFPIKLTVTPELLKGLDLCLLSVSNDALSPEFSGVTFHTKKDGMTFYSSDNETASRFTPSAKVIGRTALAVVVPQQTCQHLSKLYTAGAEGQQLSLNADLAIGVFPAAGLVSKLLPAQPDMFERVFSGHCDGAVQVPIPPGFVREITKAQIVTAKDQVKVCQLVFKDGTLTVVAVGMLGNTRGTLPCAGEGAVAMPPDKLLRALPFVDKFAVNDGKSLVLSGNGFTHIISSTK